MEFIYELNFLTYFFWFLAGICNGVMDSLQFHYKNSLLDKLDGDSDRFDPEESWVNKHRDFGNSWLANTFERLRKTALVFTTDLWHLAQWFMLTFLVMSFIFYNPPIVNNTLILEILFLRFVPFQLGFGLMYYIVLKQKKNE